MNELIEGMSGLGWVAAKALLLYLTAVFGFRLGGRRTLAEMSASDFIAAVAVGAIVGRVPNADAFSGEGGAGRQKEVPPETRRAAPLSRARAKLPELGRICESFAQCRRVLPKSVHLLECSQHLRRQCLPDFTGTRRYETSLIPAFAGSVAASQRTSF